MATIRKHRDKWQVRVRRAGLRPMSKSFAVRKDAMEWGRQMEVKADRAELPTDPKALERITLGDLVRRYRDTVSPRKKTAATETIVLNAFLTRQICSRRLSELRTEDFAAYRDQRLLTIKPTSLKRELTPVRHLFEVARHEWGLPLRENPLDRLKLKAPEQRRERRLLNGEWERLLGAARLCRNPWIEPIMRLALATGMRRGEILERLPTSHHRVMRDFPKLLTLISAHALLHQCTRASENGAVIATICRNIFPRAPTPSSQSPRYAFANWPCQRFG
jgi:hypothetical protein